MYHHRPGQVRGRIQGLHLEKRPNRMAKFRCGTPCPSGRWPTTRATPPARLWPPSSRPTSPVNPLYRSRSSACPGRPPAPPPRQAAAAGHRGWVEDIHDPHNWVQPFTVGTFAGRQNMPDDLKAQFQELVNAGVANRCRLSAKRSTSSAAAVLRRNPDHPGRSGHRPNYQQRWVQGCFYNPVMPGSTSTLQPRRRRREQLTPARCPGARPTARAHPAFELRPLNVPVSVLVCPGSGPGGLELYGRLHHPPFAAAAPDHLRRHHPHLLDAVYLSPVQRSALYVRDIPHTEGPRGVIRRYGLDRPIYEQYWNWLVGRKDTVTGEIKWAACCAATSAIHAPAISRWST